MTYYQQTGNKKIQHIHQQEDHQKKIVTTRNGQNIHMAKGIHQNANSEVNRQHQTEPQSISASSPSMNEPPSTQLQSKLKRYEDNNDQTSRESFIRDIEILYEEHISDLPTIQKNILRYANNTKSIKTTLNASARLFIPGGHNNKTSSKCKVMETIKEQNESDADIQSLNLNDNGVPFELTNKYRRVKIKEHLKSKYRSPHYLFSPPVPNKLKSIVTVPFEFTSKYIPDNIKEPIHDVYSYMNKAMAFKNNKYSLINGMGYVVTIVNFGFHASNDDQDELFCVLEQDDSAKRKWRMKKKLFDRWGLQYVYGVTVDKLPSSYKSSSSDQYEIEENIIKNTLIFIFDSISWSRMPIHAKSRTKVKQRRVLHITNQEFMKRLKQSSINHDNVIPIISVNENAISAENVMIVRLEEDVSIGISYKLEPSTNRPIVTRIYLDKNELLTCHQLASPGHKCDCLDDFVSNIDELKIGNVYDQENKIKALKKDNQKLRDENKTPIMKYIKQVLKNANKMISDNIKAALLSIKHIFNYDTIKQAIENCLKSKQSHLNQSQPPIISTSIPTCNVMNQTMQYLTTVQGNVATTIPLPQQSAVD